MIRHRKNLAVLAGAWLSLLFLACEGSKPTSFSMGQPIHLGDATMAVSYVEVTTQLGPLVRRVEGFAQVVVFLDCRGLNLEKEDVQSMKNALALFSLTLAAEDGKKFHLSGLVPENAYRMAQSQLSGDYASALSAVERSSVRPGRDWVAIFQVPVKSRGFTLLITNPHVRKGQPGVAAVSLGR